MSLTMSIPVSGNLTNVDGLQLRKNRQNKSVLYFKVAVVEDGRNGGQSKVHYLSCSLNGVMADNLYYAIQQELITTRTRLNLVLGLDTYTKPFNDPSNGNPVDVQQTSYPVWEIGVSARFAPMADVNSPGFQRLMNGQAPRQGGQFQQNQPQAPQRGSSGFVTVRHLARAVSSSRTSHKHLSRAVSSSRTSHKHLSRAVSSSRTSHKHLSRAVSSSRTSHKHLSRAVSSSRTSHKHLSRAVSSSRTSHKHLSRAVSSSRTSHRIRLRNNQNREERLSLSRVSQCVNSRCSTAKISRRSSCSRHPSNTMDGCL